jgi:predicted transcriptional regulator
MKRATSVNIRMTDELRGELQRLAEANKRTLSDYIRIVLEEHAEAQRERGEDAAKRKRPAS